MKARNLNSQQVNFPIAPVFAWVPLLSVMPGGSPCRDILSYLRLELYSSAGEGVWTSLTDFQPVLFLTPSSASLPMLLPVPEPWGVL